MAEIKGRNSLIEIFRFVFAVFIVFYHGYFIVDMPLFSHANYFVDFFFLITGYYMTATIAKYNDQSLLRGAYQIVVDRVKKIGFSLLVAYIAVILIGFLSHPDELALHYLWFIHIMLISYIVFFLLYRALRKYKELFYLVVLVIFIVSAVLRFGTLIFPKSSFFEMTSEFDELRCLCLIPIGIFLRLIPEIKFKDEKTKKTSSLMIVLAAFVLICVGIPFSSIDVFYRQIVEIVMDLIAFPVIVIFSQYINYSNKFANTLGSSSIYIYIYQCVCMLEMTYNTTNNAVFFASLIICTVVTIIWQSEAVKEKRRLYKQSKLNE